MFKRILVPTDGSELSEKAIRAAVDLAHTLKASLVGMTTLEPYSVFQPLRVPAGDAGRL